MAELILLALLLGLREIAAHRRAAAIRHRVEEIPERVATEVRRG